MLYFHKKVDILLFDVLLLVHAVTGLPVVDGGQEHIGLWSCTRHDAWGAQFPRQGGLQVPLSHQRFVAQSASLEHWVVAFRVTGAKHM